MRRILALILLSFTALTHAWAAQSPTNPDWTTPVTPFQIADNLYYVGSRDLAAYLVTTPAGNILINANLASSPPQLRSSIEQLGFQWEDVKIVLNSQAHSDHIGGLAQVLRETHAQDMVMDHDDAVVRTGGHADFDFGVDITTDFPPARVDRILNDGDTVALGDPRHGGVILTAHRTPGHTRGCTTWSMQVHVPGDPKKQRRNVVIVGGVSALPGYRLVASPGHPSSYHGIANDFEDTFAMLRSLPCDIFLGAHGLYFNLLDKLARMPKEGPKVFIDPAGYKAFVEDAAQTFQAQLTAQVEAAEATPAATQ